MTYLHNYTSLNYYRSVENPYDVIIQKKKVPQTREIKDITRVPHTTETVKLDTLDNAYRYYEVPEVEGYALLNWLIF